MAAVDTIIQTAAPTILENFVMPFRYHQVGLSALTRSEGVHFIAGWSDVGYTIRQLRLRHRERIEGFAQQLDLASLCHQVPGEQMMGRSPGRSGTGVRYI